jgi:hypothetical protein
MPRKVLDYVCGLLSVSEQATCVALSRVMGLSHDSLSRTLKNSKLTWQTLLRALILRVFGKLSDGYLIIDDVVLKKSYAKTIENLSWVYCSKEQRSVLGLNLVVLCWSNDTVTIPLTFKVWRKGDSKSKYDLALELLSYARNTLCLKPEYVTFDFWYAAKKILKRLQKYGWIFYSQIKKNRKFNNVRVAKYSSTRFWTIQGMIDGDTQVVVVKHNGKYFVTNNLEADQHIILKQYKTRWKIETMFRMLEYKLGLDECQMISLKAQVAHAYMAMMAFIILERAKMDTDKIWYTIKRELTFHPQTTFELLTKLDLVGA